MINAVTHALKNIYASIPVEILELAFDQKGGRRSLDDLIVSEIIEGRVRLDLSALAGQFKEIKLLPEWAIHSSIMNYNNQSTMDVPYAVYTVPAAEREFRSIVAVLELSLPYGSSSSLAMGAGASHNCGFVGVHGGTFAQQQMNGITGNNNLPMPTPILLAGSKIKLTPMEFSIMRYHPLHLKCRLEYDMDFTNLTPDAVIQFSEVVLAATKAYIWTKMVVKIDQGVSLSGQEIGVVRTIIDDYAGQNDRYNVLKEEFHGSAEVLDVNTLMDRLVAGIFL